MTRAFFEADGDRYHGTAHTGGPWDPTRLMHFGPPAALLGRAVTSAPTDTPKRVGRITFEVLHPVPITTLRVAAEVVRPGGRVDMVAAVLTDDDGRELALARAWRIRVGDVDVPAVGAPPGPPPPPESGEELPFFPIPVETHYANSVELRFTSGAVADPGPSAAWMRPLVPLVAGEQTTPLERLLVVADSGNGLSATDDPRRLTFVNTDLTVHLVREPVGDWVHLDARTMLDPAGMGQAEAALSDEQGRIGRSLQTLYVDRPDGS